MKLKYFSMLLSIVGITILYMISRFSQAPIIKICDMHDYEGKNVIIIGVVIEHHLTKYGGQIITIENENYTTTIIIEGKIDIEYGDKILANGEIQKYKNNWELIVNNNRQIQILKKWYNASLPLWQIAENPTKYLNLNVNVTGYIESISNSYFYLVGLEKKHSLIIFYTLSKNVTIYPGQKICALGRFTFDEKNFRYKLDICEENHGITLIARE